MTSLRDHRDEPLGEWLDGCVGYVVESDSGPIGRVAEVERDPDSGRPVKLVARAGMGGWQRLVVPIDAVAGVLPGSRRIVLSSSWAPSPDEQPEPSPAG
jgi:hypothetical protein